MDHSQAEISAEVKAEQTRLLYQAFPASVSVSVINMVLLSAVQWPVIRHDVLLTWMTIIVMITVARGLLYLRYRQKAPEERALAKWGNYFLFGTLLAAMAWGSTGLFLFPANEITHQVFVTFVLAGTCAGAVTSLSFRRAPITVFLIACLLPAMLMFLQAGSSMSMVMGVMLLLFFLVVFSTSKKIYHNTLQNISLRLEATAREALLVQTQQKHLRHVQQTPLAVIEWNTKLEVTEWNSAAESVFGYSREDVLGESVLKLIFPRGLHPQVEEDWQALLDQEGGERSSHQNITRVGRLIDCEWYNTPLFDADGDPIGIASIIQDVTDIKAAEQALLSSRREAEYASKSKSEFLANMSHEIRTPLNGTLSMAKLLERTSLDREQREYIDAIKFSGESLLAIINDVLDISKIEAGKLQLETTEFMLKPLIENTINLLTGRAQERSNTIHYTIDKSIPPMLVGDPARLRQILFNLVGNAIKFTEHGEIEVEVYQKVDSDQSDHVTLSFKVSDNGIGIAATAVPNLFNAFTQADASTSRVYGGSGLGLTICHRLIKMMGGEINVESQEGVGSTFWFELTLAPGNRQTLFEESDNDENNLPNKGRPLDILLVEDDLINQVAESRLLQQDGHKVTIAGDGYAALDILERYQESGEQPFDVILVDIHMPGLSGLETTERIRKMAAPIGTLPVIALTADVTVENIKQCNNAGIDKTLSKPLNLPELTQALSYI